MNSIRVNILGKPYPLRVEDGEEELMQTIAAFVDERFKLFKRELSAHPEQTIMVLASLSIAEELFALKNTTSNNPSENGTSDAERTEELAEINRRLQQLLGDIKSGISHI